MNAHRRSSSGGSESGWASTIATEPLDRTYGSADNTSSNSNQNRAVSTPLNHDLLIDNQDLLVNIPLSEEHSMTGAAFLPEDYSRDGSSAAASRYKKSTKHYTLAPESVAGIVDEVLISLQRARQERQETASRPLSEEDSVVSATPDGLKELKHSLKTYNRRGLPSSNEALLRRVEDFHRARFLRRQQSSAKPWGIFGLFQFLSDLQMDLEWAEDAAWRRMNHKVYLAWSDFEAIHKKTRPPPYFVYMMMFVSCFMLVVSFHMNDWEFAPISVNPMLGPSPDVLFRLGALDRRAVIEEDEWFRLLAPMFLHAGLVHFALNMLALFFIGGAVERRHGTPEAILIFPIMMNLSIIAVNSADPRLVPTLQSLGARPLQMMRQVILTTRLAILAGIITGFGRAIGEVGAAMMLGGNIEGYTRTMTTAIALETSKGEFELGLALGMVLLVIAFVLNFMLSLLNRATP